jgi:hypothetical protein
MSKKLFATLAATFLLSSQACFADEKSQVLDPSSIVKSADAASNGSQTAEALKLYKEAINSQSISEVQKAYCLGQIAECYFDSL